MEKNNTKKSINIDKSGDFSPIKSWTFEEMEKNGLGYITEEGGFSFYTYGKPLYDLDTEKCELFTASRKKKFDLYIYNSNKNEIECIKK